MNGFFRNMQGKASLLAQLAVIVVVLGALAMAMFAPHGLKKAFADTQHYGPSVSVYAIPIHLSGTNSSELSSVAAIKLPYAGRLIGFTGVSRAFGTGATPAPAVTLRAGASTVLATLGLSTVAVTEATIAAPAVAAETTLSLDLSLSGVSSVSDTTVLMTFVR